VAVTRVLVYEMSPGPARAVTGNVNHVDRDIEQTRFGNSLSQAARDAIQTAARGRAGHERDVSRRAPCVILAVLHVLIPKLPPLAGRHFFDDPRDVRFTLIADIRPYIYAGISLLVNESAP
jgi:hypothetical protein